MKAVICTKYGPPDVLKLQDIKKPSPEDDEVLIKVSASAVNYGDIIARNFKAVTPGKFNMPMLFWFFAKLYFGLRKPRIKIPGSEFSGVIESTGSKVKSFKQGDRVFGYRGQRMGAYAEYLCMPENGILSLMPADMNFEEAAVVPYGAVMALNFLRKLNIEPGQKILINGASGAIGSAAVQIAKNLFGADVTGVCGTMGLQFVKTLGADRVIDYTKDDFTENGETYDIIFDVPGRSSFSKCKNSLSKNGRYFLVSFKMKQLFQMLRTKLTGGRRVICAIAAESAEDLIFIKELVETGRIKAVIDKCFPIEQIAEAHRYAEKGSRKGGVAVKIFQMSN